MNNKRLSFRSLLSSGRSIPMLVADSPLTALALREVKAPAASIGGFAVAANAYGMPDDGSLSFSDFLRAARPILEQANDTVFLVDGEGGYDSPAETVKRWSAFPNVGMIFFEDQLPTDRRCGHMDRHTIITADEMCTKIEAARSAQIDSEPMIMARTDARSACDSIEAAIERSKAYVKAGAEAIFVEAPRSVQELELVASELSGTPLLVNIIEGGKTPILPFEQLVGMGYQLIARPLITTLAVSQLTRKIVSEFYSSDHSLENYFSEHGEPSIDDFQKLIGLSRR